MIEMATAWPDVDTLERKSRSFLNQLPSWIPVPPRRPSQAELVDLMEFAAARLQAAADRDTPRTLNEPSLQTHAQVAQGLALSLRRRARLDDGHTTVESALQFAAAELLRRGFERAMTFVCLDTTLSVAATAFVTAEPWAVANHANAAANPIPLAPELFEAMVINAQRPALVQRPLEDPRAFTPIVGRMECADYVVAPIVLDGTTVGTIHADCFFSGTVLDNGHRDEIAIFAAEISAQLQGDQHIGQPTAPRRRTDHTLASNTPTLSERERQVYDGLTRGLTNRQIAAELHVGTETVKTYVSRLLRKLGVPNRSAAVGLGLSV